MTSIQLGVPDHVIRRVDNDGGVRHSTAFATVIEFYTGAEADPWSEERAGAKLFYWLDAVDTAQVLDASDGPGMTMRYSVLGPGE